MSADGAGGGASRATPTNAPPFTPTPDLSPLEGGIITLTNQTPDLDTAPRDRPVEITPAMIEAGVRALARACPLDLAFPIGGEEGAVEDVLTAALALASVALRPAS